ncbi:MAG: Uncharacterized protein YjgR, partial [uncultured Lysobacter sp.]
GRRRPRAGHRPRRQYPAPTDRPRRQADPLQGRGRLLRHPDAQGRAGRGAGPAGQPGPARAARLHPGRRQGAQGDRRHVP